MKGNNQNFSSRLACPAEQSRTQYFQNSDYCLKWEKNIKFSSLQAIRGARNFPTGNFLAQTWIVRFRLNFSSALFLPRDSLVAGFCLQIREFFCIILVFMLVETRFIASFVNKKYFPLYFCLRPKTLGCARYIPEFFRGYFHHEWCGRKIEVAIEN